MIVGGTFSVFKIKFFSLLHGSKNFADYNFTEINIYLLCIASIKNLLHNSFVKFYAIALLSLNLIVMKPKEFVTLLSDSAVESRLQVILTSKLESVLANLLPLYVKEII